MLFALVLYQPWGLLLAGGGEVAAPDDRTRVGVVQRGSEPVGRDVARVCFARVRPADRRASLLHADLERRGGVETRLGR